MYHDFGQDYQDRLDDQREALEEIRDTPEEADELADN